MIVDLLDTTVVMTAGTIAGMTAVLLHLCMIVVALPTMIVGMIVALPEDMIVVMIVGLRLKIGVMIDHRLMIDVVAPLHDLMIDEVRPLRVSTSVSNEIPLMEPDRHHIKAVLLSSQYNISLTNLFRHSTVRSLFPILQYIQY
jgi:hypothetical protein